MCRGSHSSIKCSDISSLEDTQVLAYSFLRAPRHRLLVTASEDNTLHLYSASPSTAGAQVEMQCR